MNTSNQTDNTWTSPASKGSGVSMSSSSDDVTQGSLLASGLMPETKRIIPSSVIPQSYRHITSETTTSTLKTSPVVAGTGPNLVILAGVLVALVVLVAIVIIVCFVLKKRRRLKTSPQPSVNRTSVRTGRSTWHEDETNTDTNDLELQPSNIFGSYSNNSDDENALSPQETKNSNRFIPLTSDASDGGHGNGALKIVENEQNGDVGEVRYSSEAYSVVCKKSETLKAVHAISFCDNEDGDSLSSDAHSINTLSDDDGKLDLHIGDNTYHVPRNRTGTNNSDKGNINEKSINCNDDDEIYTNFTRDTPSFSVEENINVRPDVLRRTISEVLSTKGKAPVPQPRMSLKSRNIDPYDYPPRRAFSLQTVPRVMEVEDSVPDQDARSVSSNSNESGSGSESENVYHTVKITEDSDNQMDDGSCENDVIYDVPRPRTDS